jgi:hypothetical protein
VGDRGSDVAERTDEGELHGRRGQEHRDRHPPRPDLGPPQGEAEQDATDRLVRRNGRIDGLVNAELKISSEIRIPTWGSRSFWAVTRATWLATFSASTPVQKPNVTNPTMNVASRGTTRRVAMRMATPDGTAGTANNMPNLHAVASDWCAATATNVSRWSRRALTG